MSSRDLGFTALGRCLAVERYRELCLSSPPRRPGPARTGDTTHKSDLHGVARPAAARPS